MCVCRLDRIEMDNENESKDDKCLKNLIKEKTIFCKRIFVHGVNRIGLEPKDAKIKLLRSQFL
jgi:hypothetical protein